MSETEITATSLGVWMPGPEGLAKCDLALSAIRVARLPDGGAVLVVERAGQVGLRFDLTAQAAVHLAACLVGEPGAAR